MPAKKRRQQLIVAAGVVVVALVVTLVLIRLLGSDPKELRYDQLIDRVDSGDVEEATLHSAQGQVTGKLEDGTEFTASVTTEGSDDLARLISRSGAELKVDTAKSSWWEDLLLNVGPTVLVLGAFLYFMMNMQGGGIGGLRIGRSGSKTRTVDSQVTFADVAGADEAVAELSEIRDFLSDPDRFAAMGARIPKGVLLFGPPGTGKTLLARAVAGEAGVPFMSLSGSDFVEMFVGVGASRVRDLFKQAKADAPAIIFVDEIDAVGRHRGAGVGGGHDEREQTLNQLLVEMDGFDPTTGVILMAATNRPDILDPALLRPGRFDRQIVVPLPENEERLAILKVYSRDKRMGPDVDLEVMSKATPGMSGADLANLVNEAALFAVRRGSKQIERIDFENARDRVVMGARRESLVLSAEEKRATAIHEGGHAILTVVLPNSDPLHKVTILPRGMALGVTWSLPEERHTYSKEYFDDLICKAMGGRVAEKIVFGHLNSGAANDLEQATSIARRMVREWGMSDAIGPMAWSGHQQVFLGEDLMTQGREYSDDTAKLVDSEIFRILHEQEARATEVLTKYRPALEMVAQALLERETIDGAEVAQLVHASLDETPSSEAANAE